MKIRTVETELFHADGRADEQTGRDDNSDSRFTEFCKTHLKSYISVNLSSENRPVLAWDRIWKADLIQITAYVIVEYIL